MHKIINSWMTSNWCSMMKIKPINSAALQFTTILCIMWPVRVNMAIIEIIQLTLGSTSGLQGWDPRAVRCPRDLDFFFRDMMLCFWNILEGSDGQQGPLSDKNRFLSEFYFMVLRLDLLRNNIVVFIDVWYWPIKTPVYWCVRI